MTNLYENRHSRLRGGKLSPHFGHSEAFALVDVDNGEITGTNFVPSPPQPTGTPAPLAPGARHGRHHRRGHGHAARQLFAEKNIEVVIGAPNLEPEAIVADYVSGKLQTVDNPCDHGEGHGERRPPPTAWTATVRTTTDCMGMGDRGRGSKELSGNRAPVSSASPCAR